jgi:uncharacterized membrane protein
MKDKMSGIVMVAIGLLLMVAALLDLFSMGGVEPGVTSIVPGWSNMRLVMLSIGGVVGVFGCYMMIKKKAKPA